MARDGLTRSETGMIPARCWVPPRAVRPIDAVVTLPGSKSLTNRFLVLAALADDVSRLRRPLRSRDTVLMAAALRGLGARIVDHGPDDARDRRDAADDLETPTGQPYDLDWIVTPGPLTGGTAIDCGLAGTVMRFLPAVAALADGPVRFDGDEQARRRPMGPALQALRSLGVSVDTPADGGSLPFTVHGAGRVRGGEVRLDASASSQFVSALLLAGARFDEGVVVVHDGPPVPSEPHITMTVEVLRDAGVPVDDAEPNRWVVEPSGVHALDVQVEPDLSNAAAFLAGAMATGGRVHVPGWPQHTTQAGDAIRDIFDAMGGDVVLSREGLTVTGPDRVNGLDVDLHDVGELTPVVAAVAALADSPSSLRGVAHLRGHETDRLAALATEIGRLGGHVEVLADGLYIHPRPLRGDGVVLATYDDHRMAMAATILGLVVPGVAVADVETTGKTLPDFTRRWEAMVNGVANGMVNGMANGMANGAAS